MVVTHGSDLQKTDKAVGGVGEDADKIQSSPALHQSSQAMADISMELGKYQLNFARAARRGHKERKVCGGD